MILSYLILDQNQLVYVPTVQTIPFLATSMSLGKVPLGIGYSFTYVYQYG